MYITINRLSDSELSPAQFAELDSIFFEASATRSFASPEAREAFRQRWLGNYLTNCKNETFIAMTPARHPIGYVVGALNDPAQDPYHADLDYFRHFAPWTRLYPAHLHINVASQHRSGGLGSRMVEAFADNARARGAPGMHIVTGQGMRNVGFYLRNGFEHLTEAEWNGRTVVMLGRKLA